jgi:Lin1244/Lin1753-like, N-terminal
MKWFHHECTAGGDSRLQVLITSCGMEGYGIYWRILETIGHQSDGFQLKIDGVSGSPDAGEGGEDEQIPTFALSTLAYNFRTESEKLLTVIEVSVRAGLFDRDRWLKSNILYSPGFEERADRYKRRRNKPPANPSAPAEGLPQTSRNPEKVWNEPFATLRLEQNRTEEKRTEEKREKKDLLLENIADGEKLSTLPKSEKMLNEKTEENEEFVKSASEIVQTIRSWNERRNTRFEWVPTCSQLRKLLYGGDPRRKEWLRYETMNMLGGDVTYVRIVQRAVLLMLESSQRRRIVNPFGWVWACLHGSSGGARPWVQLTTAGEEA